MTLLAVALGGAIGSVLRYLAGGVVQRTAAAGFPFGTLVVNILGCLTVGVLGQMLVNTEAPSAIRGLLVIGLCGGFTTFSAFSLETVGLLHSGEYGKAALYVSLSTCLCIVATAAGMLMGRGFAR